MQSKNEETTLPSITALSVAAAFHRALDTKYKYLFSEEELALIKHFVNTGIELYPLSFNWGLIKSVSILPYPIQQGFFNKLVIPAYDEMIMLRKLMIRYKLAESIANGAKQVVILGGGYDIRALIAATEYPEVMFYELDTGATRQHKLQAIHAIPDELKFDCKVDESTSDLTKINTNLFYIEADLDKIRLSDVLIPNGFQSTEQTFFLAEGLTCYLTEDSNRQLLNSIHQLFKNGQSELLISYITENRYFSVVAETAHKESDERYKFSLPIHEVLPFAKTCSFSIVAKKSSVDMLEAIGREDCVKFYKNNQNIREYYYLLKSSLDVLKSNNSMDEVPEMNVLLSPIPREEESACMLM